MIYENLLMEYEKNLIIKEKPLKAYDGRIKGNRILIRNDMTRRKKCCVLAEEIGHYYTTVGNILDQSNDGKRKQELQARLWAYNKLISKRRPDCDRNKYGTQVKFEGYIITFIPTLDVRNVG